MVVVPKVESAAEIEALAKRLGRPVLAMIESPAAAFEARALATALIQAAGDATQARARLGLPRKTFYDKIKRHGLDLMAFRGKDRPKT